MTQPDQTNDTGAQQTAEAQQPTAEQLLQKTEAVLAAVTPQAASAAAAAQNYFGKVLAWVAGLTKMAPASIRKPWVGALALSAALLLIATLVFSGGNTPEGAAIAYNTAVYKGEVDKALALVHFPEGKRETILEALRQGKEFADDKGGLVRVEVVSSEIDRTNPDRARVRTRVHFKNEQISDKGVYGRVKGKWMVETGFFLKPEDLFWE